MCVGDVCVYQSRAIKGRKDRRCGRVKLSAASLMETWHELNMRPSLSFFFLLKVLSRSWPLPSLCPSLLCHLNIWDGPSGVCVCMGGGGLWWKHWGKLLRQEATCLCVGHLMCAWELERVRVLPVRTLVLTLLSLVTLGSFQAYTQILGGGGKSHLIQYYILHAQWLVSEIMIPLVHMANRQSIHSKTML